MTVFSPLLREEIRRGAKVSLRRRVQKLVIVQLPINRTPLNQSESRYFAPLAIIELIEFDRRVIEFRQI